MKVKMYMAISLNGYIAKENDEVDWMQEAQWESYDREVAASGHILLGRRTYEMLEDEELNVDCQYYVLTSNEAPTQKDNVTFLPLDVVRIRETLEQNNAEEVLVIGGAKTNSFLLNAGFIDEVMIDIEPLILSRGINLIESLKEDIKLELISTGVVAEGLLQLKYKVIN